MRSATRYKFAKVVQLWGWIGFGVFVAIGLKLFHIPDDWRFFLAFMLIGWPVIGGLFFRCERCPASYFYDERRGNFLMGPLGYNLLKPVKPVCPRCGFDRSRADYA